MTNKQYYARLLDEGLLHAREGLVDGGSLCDFVVPNQQDTDPPDIALLALGNSVNLPEDEGLRTSQEAGKDRQWQQRQHH